MHMALGARQGMGVGHHGAVVLQWSAVGLAFQFVGRLKLQP